MLDKLTIKQQLYFYKIWCKDNHKKPQEYRNLQLYFNEIETLRKEL